MIVHLARSAVPSRLPLFQIVVSSVAVTILDFVEEEVVAQVSSWLANGDIVFEKIEALLLSGGAFEARGSWV